MVNIINGTANPRATYASDMSSLGSLDTIMDTFKKVISDTADKANGQLQQVIDDKGNDTSHLAVYQKDLNNATMVQTTASTLMKKITDLAQSINSNIR
ncbi:hypothetical protein WJ69_34195 [Burkholderia ubonensis]|uniref:EscF/YscF/HrpA family type III secretion system needle major subunit n=1 Tax=Burkholderia ubonensis TaxID=101571 RepID=UPI000753FBBE|nr:EscF/YscF/HrpA family type III secretion system needle major subunit [Burkholderia ubonensis]KVN98510.1 hypothetical protein WJ69_34195 [Burkholderia ubonensis]